MSSKRNCSCTRNFWVFFFFFFRKRNAKIYSKINSLMNNPGPGVFVLHILVFFFPLLLHILFLSGRLLISWLVQSCWEKRKHLDVLPEGVLHDQGWNLCFYKSSWTLTTSNGFASGYTFSLMFFYISCPKHIFTPSWSLANYQPPASSLHHTANKEHCQALEGKYTQFSMYTLIYVHDFLKLR